jgi:hypothetical protein
LREKVVQHDGFRGDKKVSRRTARIAPRSAHQAIADKRALCRYAPSKVSPRGEEWKDDFHTESLVSQESYSFR